MTPATQEHRIHLAGYRAMVEEAKRIRAELCASRGLPPSSGCMPAQGRAEQLPEPVEVESEGGSCD